MMLDNCAWGSVCVEIAVLGCEEGCCVGKAVGRVVGGEIKVREGLIRGRSGVHLLVEHRLLKSLDVGPADVW